MLHFNTLCQAWSCSISISSRDTHPHQFRRTDLLCQKLVSLSARPAAGSLLFGANRMRPTGVVPAEAIRRALPARASP